MPRVHIEQTEPGQIRPLWNWSERYADRTRFTVLVTEDLSESYIDAGLEPAGLGGGAFEMILPDFDNDRAFYRVGFSLR